VTPERWQKIDSIFRGAVRLDAAKRTSYLDDACGADADLRAEVDSLLAADRADNPLAGSALDSLDTGELASAVGNWCAAAPEHAPADSAPTVGWFGTAAAVEPVVGWLVCVRGPEEGRDYRIRSEHNRIGRDRLMDICLRGDNRVSRDTHAIVTYDPRQNQFRVSPGHARGIIYLNGRLLDSPSPLRPRDIIELGDTGLQFVPFCGERFQWK
jgi:hypothetical protein